MGDATTAALSNGRRISKQANTRMTRAVHNNPVLALGVALGIGLMLGLSARR